MILKRTILVGIIPTQECRPGGGTCGTDGKKVCENGTVSRNGINVGRIDLDVGSPYVRLVLCEEIPVAAQCSEVLLVSDDDYYIGWFVVVVVL